MDIATVDKLLTTTRSVRKRLDLERPVEPEVLEKCIEIAVQAPSGSNLQGYHFVAVTDPELKRGIADFYRKAWSVYARNPDRPPLPEGDPRLEKMPRIAESASYLAAHLHEVPVLVIPCIEGRVENAPPAAQASLYGSIIPAAWSLMLALRVRGLGAAWTTLHLAFERETARLLGIPDNITQAALLPVAYYKGEDFSPAQRLSAGERTYWNRWGQPRSQ